MGRLTANRDLIQPAATGRGLSGGRDHPQRPQAAEARQSHVVGNRQPNREALVLTILADHAGALPPSPRRRSRSQIRSDLDRARGYVVEPENGSHQLGTSSAYQSGDSQDLTAPEGQTCRDRLLGAGQISDLQGRIAGASLVRRVKLVHLASDHQGHDIVRARAGGRSAARGPAIAEHRETVADLLDLFQEMGDVDHRQTLGPETENEREELLDIVSGEAAGRFVENQHAAFQSHGPGDFDHLLLGNRQPPDFDFGGHVGGAHLRHGPDCPPSSLSPTDQRPEGRFNSQEDVLHDRQVRRQRKLLIDHGHSALAGSERAVRSEGHAVQPDPPPVGRMGPGEDLH